jgi:dihydrofolate synthase/folylpolyglutamate synthase
MPDAHAARLDYLFGRLNYEQAGMPRQASELGLRRMRRLLKALGDPQDSLRIVHVAGTKGKGSTGSMIASALSASGVGTGLFCSPHLHRLEERFQIDGVEATPGEIVSLVDEVRPRAEVVDATDRHARGRDLTFFEITTAMGLLHFARRGCEAAVVEVGMGGRLDSTNAVRPELAVITPISFDHTRQLGPTLSAIATEKAGILKRRGTAVVGARGDEPREAIARVAERRRSRVLWIDRDFREHYEPPGRPVVRPTPGKVTVETWRGVWGPIDLPMLGPHQAQNAAIALASLDVLAERGLVVPPEAVVRGFASLRFPARVEVLGERPWLVVDGAHNVASAVALAETLETNLPGGPRTLVFGTTREKDMIGQLQALLPRFSEVVATQYLENPRAVAPEDVADAVLALSGREPHVAFDPASALEKARAITPPEGLICVSGSLFLAAEARALVLGTPPFRVPSTSVV